MLAYDDSGSDGSAVVLLHSGVCDRRMWRQQVTALADRGYRCIAPDLPGFGDSRLSRGLLSFSAEVLHLLASLDVARAAVVGASLGGRVALELASRSPATVTALALLCPAYRGLEPTADAQAFEAEEERLLEAGDVEGAVALNVRTWLAPSAAPAIRSEVAAMQRQAFALQLAAEEADDPPRLEPAPVDPAALDAPTLVVSGGRDMDHFQQIARHLAAELPVSRLIRLDEAAHLPSLERPEEVTRLLVEFLADPDRFVVGREG